jgi:hypothetical protein
MFVPAQMKHCEPNPKLVGPGGRYPSEPFDNLVLPGRDTGCNQLRCRRCQEGVQAQLLGATKTEPRRYACACQSHDVFFATTVGPQELWHDLYGNYTRIDVDHWYCSGHPEVPFPMSLSGVPIDEDANFCVIAKRAAMDPTLSLDPTISSIWMERVYFFVPHNLRPIVGAGIASLLEDSEARAVLMALSFFGRHAQAHGAARVLSAVTHDRERLLGIVQPGRPGRTALHLALGVLCCRLRAREENASMDSSNAEIVAILQRELLLGVDACSAWGGSASELYLKEHAPEWLDANDNALAAVFKLHRDQQPFGLGSLRNAKCQHVEFLACRGSS